MLEEGGYGEYSEEFKIGIDNKATAISIETRIIFIIRTFLFINCDIFTLAWVRLKTKRAWAIISNIIKPRRTNLLKKLSNPFKNWKESSSKFIPRKIECIIKKIAEPTPKNKKTLFLWSPKF